jgi:hypothetical protein
MSVGPTGALPDPAVLSKAGLDLAQAAPPDWTAIDYVMFWLETDVYGERMWVEGPTLPRKRVRTPRVGLALEKLREAQVAAGQEAWVRCDVRLARAPGSQQPQFDVNFSYELGEIPE